MRSAVELQNSSIGDVCLNARFTDVYRVVPGNYTYKTRYLNFTLLSAVRVQRDLSVDLVSSDSNVVISAWYYELLPSNKSFDYRLFARPLIRGACNV